MQREIIDNNLLLCHNMTCIWRKNDMEEYIMKSRFMRIIAVIMAISLLVCSFASCQIAIEEEPADGNVDIAGPDDLNSDEFTEDNSDTNNNGVPLPTIERTLTLSIKLCITAKPRPARSPPRVL